jgi:hypothetical protein
MSRMIRCDKCKTLMYADSRSDKGNYCELNINYTDGYSKYHLCKVCHRQLMTEFLRDYTPEEYDEIFGERQGEG